MNQYFTSAVRPALLLGAVALLIACVQPAAAGALTFYGHCISEDAGDCMSLTPEGSEKSVLVTKEPIIEPHHIANAELAADSQIDEPVILITFTEEGTARFARATTARIGKSIYMLDKGRLISTPNVREPITGGKGQISGGYTEAEAQDLVDRILANRQTPSN